MSNVVARVHSRAAPAEAILLVRLDGIGDAALCIPALEGMASAFPDAAFGAVCSPANATLFSDRVRHVLVHHADRPAEELRSLLAAERYTRALVATEEVAGYLIARISGARERAGFWHGWQKPFKSIWQRSQVTKAVYRPAAWSDSPAHEVEVLYRLAQALGAKAPAPADPAALRTWLRIERPAQSEALANAIGFQISQKLLSGGWSPVTLAQLFGSALQSSGLQRAALITSAADEGLASSVMEQLPADMQAEHRVRIVSSLSLPRWIGVLDTIAVLVTPDTGSAHVAGMLGRNVIDLFDERAFNRLSNQWHPWAGNSRCLMKPEYTRGSDEALGTQIGGAIRAQT